jgi:hypothetical protein
VSTTINVPGVLNQSYSRSFGYDTAGRLSTISYPNMTVGHEYSALGYLVRYRHVQSGNVLDEVTDTDAYGNVTEQRFWNAGLRTSRGYETTSGRLTSIQTGTTAAPKSIQELSYVWQSNNALPGTIEENTRCSRVHPK